MDIKKAIKVLDNHQRWRLGDEKITQTNPRELTESIDLILKEVKKSHLHGINNMFSKHCPLCEEETTHRIIYACIECDPY